MQKRKSNDLLNRYGMTDFLVSYEWCGGKKTHHRFKLPNGYRVDVEVDEDGFYVVKSGRRGRYEVVCLEDELSVSNKLYEIAQKK